MNRTVLGLIYICGLCGLTGLAALGGSGCANQAFSPPAGWIPAEEPPPLPKGKRAINGSIGGGDIGLDAADLIGAEVKYRQGVADLLELQVQGGFVDITEHTHEFPAILSARIGLKGGFVASFPHLSWNAGIGFGGSAGGIFGAADAGLQLGYVNPYLVPWIGLSGIASLPITSEDVDLRGEDDDDPNLDHPVTTFGVRLGLGLTAHLGTSDARLTVAFANLKLFDIHGKDESVSGFTVGFDIPF